MRWYKSAAKAIIKKHLKLAVTDEELDIILEKQLTTADKIGRDQKTSSQQLPVATAINFLAHLERRCQSLASDKVIDAIALNHLLTPTLLVAVKVTDELATWNLDWLNQSDRRFEAQYLANRHIFAKEKELRAKLWRDLKAAGGSAERGRKTDGKYQADEASFGGRSLESGYESDDARPSKTTAKQEVGEDLKKKIIMLKQKRAQASFEKGMRDLNARSNPVVGLLRQQIKSLNQLEQEHLVALGFKVEVTPDEASQVLANFGDPVAIIEFVQNVYQRQNDFNILSHFIADARKDPANNLSANMKYEHAIKILKQLQENLDFSDGNFVKRINDGLRQISEKVAGAPTSQARDKVLELLGDEESKKAIVKSVVNTYLSRNVERLRQLTSKLEQQAQVLVEAEQSKLLPLPLLSQRKQELIKLTLQKIECENDGLRSSLLLLSDEESDKELEKVIRTALDKNQAVKAQLEAELKVLHDQATVKTESVDAKPTKVVATPTKAEQVKATGMQATDCISAALTRFSGVFDSPLVQPASLKKSNSGIPSVLPSLII